ncbi:TPA: hypothetical protein CPT98_06680 [Candidatus Gastranaerophilales bacterium HUM_19]|nr:MAG TPA: hypothetical protein CPT97_06940 [Candidatus Gastranaerophilales bacterium HUM_17]DAB17107.1 MAG TPA: hypothetical protein CPT98_06680 [Candidatus Gastranaerophilales bacterium HUM_19]DAB26359.1 MAG TPA: hypothetical protein CPT86_02765 [Candidatus Gastranaerophilales bacterium HUM_23]
MTNSETKNFSQNVSSSYHLEDRDKCNKNTCANTCNVPKLRFKGYNVEWKKVRTEEIFENVTIKNKPSLPVLAVTQERGTILRESCGINIKYENESLKSYKLVKPGNFIISLRSFQGGLEYSGLEGIVSPAYTILNNKQSISYDFFKYYFKTYNFIKSLNIAVEGIRDGKQISYNSFKDIKITFPNIEEQEKIASFLTLIDKKIEKQKELVELLKKYKRGLLSAIFSQKLKFKDDNGNDYPAWEEKSLGEVTGNISYGLNAASKDYDGENKYIRITDIDETTGKFNNLDIVSPDCVLSDDYKLKINDLLFARTGASTGKTYLYNENDGKMYFAGFLIKFSIKNEYCSNFIFYITQTFNYKKWVSIMSARSGQPGINAKEYSNYKFSCPVYDEQVKISNIISKLDNIIEKENILLDSYNDYKKGLLQKLFI